MKKLFSLLLAAVLALGLTTIAWAVTEEEPGGQAGQTYTDDDRIVIEKCYRLVNDGAVSPAETFHFTLTTLGVTDSTETLDTMPRFTDADGAPITGFDISFAEGEATAAGTVKSYTLMLPEYDTVGIYSYEIAEVVDDDVRTAGVTYNGQKLLLKVTVIQTEDGRVRVAAVHLGNEDGDKVKQVVNTYAAGTLDVTKTVAGLMGETNRDFRFTVTLTRPAELVMASTIGLTVAGTAQSFTPVWDSNGRCTVTFDLRHGQTASLTNLPYGMSYTVAEDDYTAIGYTTEKTGDSGTVSAAGVTAAFTNTKGGSVDTGVLLDSAPYALLLVLALGGGAVLFLRRRAHRSLRRYEQKDTGRSGAAGPAAGAVGRPGNGDGSGGGAAGAGDGQRRRALRAGDVYPDTAGGIRRCAPAGGSRRRRVYPHRGRRRRRDAAHPL